MAPVFHVKEHILPASHIRQYPRATSLSQDEELVQHVKQYTPRDNPNPQKGDVTIVGAHANGFPKELYEPLWEDIYQEAKSRGIRIRSIIIADAAWQGQSGSLNGTRLGNDPSWFDYTRDILHMINTLRPPRPLVGIGHSFGAAAILFASLTSPRLFASLEAASPATMSVRRRDVWPSRAAAAEAFARNPFYSSWDPRTLRLWGLYGVTPSDPSDPDGEVRLSTTRHQELFTFLRPTWHAYDPERRSVVDRSELPDLERNATTDRSTGPQTDLTWPFYRPEPLSAVSCLPAIRPPVLYVFGGQSYLSTPDSREEKLRLTGTGVGGSGGAKEGRVKAAVAPDNGHLVPLEAPSFCAREVVQWLRTELDRWRDEESIYEEWTRRPQGEKSTLSEDFKHFVANPHGPAKKGSAKI